MPKPPPPAKPTVDHSAFNIPVIPPPVYVPKLELVKCPACNGSTFKGHCTCGNCNGTGKVPAKK